MPTHSPVKGFSSRVDSSHHVQSYWNALKLIELGSDPQLQQGGLWNVFDRQPRRISTNKSWLLTNVFLIKIWCMAFGISGAASSAISEDCRSVSVTVNIELQKGIPSFITLILPRICNTQSSKAVRNYAWKHILYL